MLYIDYLQRWCALFTKLVNKDDVKLCDLKKMDDVM